MVSTLSCPLLSAVFGGVCGVSPDTLQALGTAVETLAYSRIETSSKTLSRDLDQGFARDPQ